MVNPIVATRKSTRRSIAVVPSQAETFSPIKTRKSFTPGPRAIADRKVITTPKTPLVLSKECTASTAANQPGKAQYTNPIMAKINRDLNSPSATARYRANKAMKSPTYAVQNYGMFDVPHETQDLITEEERAPMKTKTVEEIFQDCKIYVEVRAGDDNRSEGIKMQLLKHGITVNENFYKDTTHVIFKDGRLATYKTAVERGVPLTTVLWFEACIVQKRLVDPTRYKISNLDTYENPELHKKIRVKKSMQPDTSKFRPYNITPTVKKRNSILPVQRDTPKALETTELEAPMELTLQNVTASMQNETTSMQEATPGPQLAKANCDMRRLTTFTPNPMEQTGKLAVDRRKSFCTPRSSQHSSEVSTPDGHAFNVNSSNTIVFNSYNKLSQHARRSTFDISMNILEMNCRTMSQKKDEGEGESEAKTDTPKGLTNYDTQALPAVAVRKRKLFNNDCLMNDIEECKENFNKTTEKKSKMNKSIAFKTPQMEKKTKPAIDRRRTLDFFKAEKRKEVTVATKKTPVKQIVAQKVIVCTNMSSADKVILNCAIGKLGGHIESEVSSRTTHVVSPNVDRTMNVLRGVIRACLIVTPKWIHDSIEKDKWLDTSTYQHDIVDSHRVYERSILGTKNYQNLTFENQGLFYLSEETIDNVKKISYMKEIVNLCSGTFTENKAEARFIITDRPTTVDNPKQFVVVTTFVFDSAMKGKCMDPSLYKPKA